MIAGCKGKKAAREDAGVKPIAVRSDAAADAWPELAKFPRAEPVHVVALPVRASTPRFDVGGPVIAGGVAIVSSSQFGFVAVDVRRGQLAWARPAGLHVAPPLARASDAVLIGDCVTPPDVPAGERLLGCLRVVTPAGADLGYVAIHGRGAELAAFAAAAGPQQVWASGDRTVSWRRGDAAVAIDTLTGAAAPASAEPPPIVASYRGHTWQITRDDDGTIVARERGKLAWRSPQPCTALLGTVTLADQAPMVRVSVATVFAGAPELDLLDLDATGSQHGQAAFPVPGIGLVGHAIDSVGDVALAVQLDSSLARDFIVGYAANARLEWVYPLPRVPRTDPVGLAIAPGAVVAFHDGDTLTILPEVSTPPTAPGAPAAASENATP